METSGAWEDNVAAAMRDWACRDDSLDVDSMEIVVRLSRLARQVAVDVAEVHGAVGLGPGDFDVLASILRSGPTSPKMLAQQLLLSKAGVSGRLARLRRRGLIQESVRPEDGRGKSIALTAEGRRVVEGVVAAHAAAERQALAALTPNQQRELLVLLRHATARPGDSDIG